MDILKSVLSAVEHGHKTSRAWKQKFWAIVRTGMRNSYILWRSRVHDAKTRPMRSFLLDFIHAARTAKEPQYPKPQQTYHALVHIENARKCIQLGHTTRWVCVRCATPSGVAPALCGDPTRSCAFNFHRYGQQDSDNDEEM